MQSDEISEAINQIATAHDVPEGITDALGRTPISMGMKRQIAEAFRTLPPGHTVAVVAIADTKTGDARLHIAAKLGKDWKVAGGLGVPVKSPRKSSGWVGIEWSR